VAIPPLGDEVEKRLLYGGQEAWWAEMKITFVCLPPQAISHVATSSLHHPRSGRLHVAAMSLTGDEGSSGPMSFLGKER